jgi:hypothetical protein
MSVKSASERSGNGDEVRRTRETYQGRETENAKKQSKQLKNLSEAHNEEILQLQEDHQKQLAELKDKTSEAISRRDIQYQKEMDELREMHNKQLQRVSQDAETKMARSEEASKEEKERGEKISQQQRDILKGSYESQLRDRDKHFEDYSANATKTQSEDLKRSRGRQQEVHDKELYTVIKDRDDRIASQQRSTSDRIKYKDEQLKDLEKSRQNEKARLLANHEVSLRNAGENEVSMAENSREVLKDGIRRNREYYERKVDKMQEENEGSRTRLSESVNDRINNHLTQVEGDFQKLKDDQPRMRVKYEQQKSRELNNLRDSLGDNIRQLEDVRGQTVEASNGKTKVEIERINKANDEFIGRTNKFFQDKISMENSRSDERQLRSELDHKKQLSNEQISNKSRFEKLKNASETDQGKMRAFFERSAGSMRENFENTLRDMRERNKRDQEQMFAQFSKTAQENDEKFQQKVNEISGRYERQLVDTEEVHAKEMKDQQTVADRQRAELQKKADTDIKSQASQYQYRLAKTEDLHKRENDQLEKRHQESLANLTKNRQT